MIGGKKTFHIKSTVKLLGFSFILNPWKTLCVCLLVLKAWYGCLQGLRILLLSFFSLSEKSAVWWLPGLFESNKFFLVAGSSLMGHEFLILINFGVEHKYQLQGLEG